MSTLTITTHVSTDGLDQLTDKLEPQGLRDLHSKIATSLGEFTRRYLIRIGNVRHNTANRIGAAPSMRLHDAANNIETEHSQTHAAAHIFSPLVSRAFRDITIVPRYSKALTIPLRPESYNTPAREIDGLFIYKSKQGRAFLAKAAPGKGRLHLYYLLLKKVEQKQDRTLLPSDDAIRQIATRETQRHLANP